MWRWWNYAVSRVPPLKEPLRLNMDETSVALYQGSAKGTVFVSKKRRRGVPVQRVSRKAQRTCLTHVAFICDQTFAQPSLPQVVIGNCATFLVRDWTQLNAESPVNVHLIRQKSAWNNEGVCRRIIRLLGAALRPFSARFQPILLMDARRVHLHPSIARCCAAEGIWLLIVPAKLTWLLQPCDTHAFQSYKAYLKAAYQRMRVDAAAVGEVGIRDFLRALCDAIRFLLQGKRWALAFDRDGFGAPPGQREVASDILKELELDAVPAIGAAPPSEDILRLCFPRNAAVPTAALLRPMAPMRPPALAAAQLPAARGALMVPRSRVAPKAVGPAAPAGVMTRAQAAQAAQARLRAALAAGPGF